MTTPWSHRYAQRMQGMGSSAIREILKLTQQPEIISFAGGLPAPELFPTETFAAAADRVLTRHGTQALQYGTTEGFNPLREFIVEKMGQYGIRATVENVLLTSGAQQALDLMGRILLNPGDPILTENPTYLGALQAWRGYQADFVSVPIDDEGLQIDLLQETMCAGPKFMYILPNFQNPGGVTLSLERRQKLVATADRYGCPIVEDDPYGELRFEGEHLPPLVVLDADRLNHRAPDSHFDRGNVIYVSTFSKTLAPGLRLGWMVAPRGVIQRAVMAKQGMDLHTSSFVQRVVHEVVRDGFLPGHVRRIRDVYRQRRDLMLAALERHFPPGVRWTRPQGGLFLWAMLPEQIDSVTLLKRAVENKVAFVPGANFYPDGSGHNTMRLNFSNATPEQIEIGIERLGQVIADTLEEEPLEPVLTVPAL